MSPILIFKKCSFYRTNETLSRGRGLGYCDLFGEAPCEGDVQFCEDPNALRKQLLELKNSKGEEDQEKKSSKCRVLVVDDQEQMRNLVVALLSEQGHQCITAGNGSEALNKINQNKFDAVITDIVMPQMDGIALTKELLTLYPNLPIMVITGYSKEYPTELAITAGARDFIGKPFSIDEFILRFNKMMGDQAILCQMEAKQIEMVLHLQSKT